MSPFGIGGGSHLELSGSVEVLLVCRRGGRGTSLLSALLIPLPRLLSHQPLPRLLSHQATAGRVKIFKWFYG